MSGKQSLRPNHLDAIKGWLAGRLQDIGEPLVKELLLGWLAPFLTEVEKDRLTGWHLGVSL
tara:strand:+ start:427 stop:609 length:183 start_codon:yes stop_codon:yes gene_type:complete